MKKTHFANMHMRIIKKNKNITRLPRNKILPQMFDVRPVDRSGDLDMERIKKLRRIVKVSESPSLEKSNIDTERNQAETEVPEFLENNKNFEKEENDLGWGSAYIREEEIDPEPSRQWNFGKPRRGFGKKYFFAFSGLSLAVCAVFFVFNFVNRGLDIKEKGMVKGRTAFADLVSAQNSLREGNFEKSQIQFSNAKNKLGEISGQLSGMRIFFVDAMKYVPYVSKISSANNLVAVGQNISEAGVLISDMLETMEKIKNGYEKESLSYLALFKESEVKLKKISELLGDAQDNLENVNIDDIPEENRQKLVEIKRILPDINLALDEFLAQEKILVDILGGNGPRKYLFLFQNNHEMRATGGFIGSYALLDIFEGRVRNFFIDGIFNPDGQLKERIVPPAPIQKISANWSLHDSNWFPDWTVSAEKAAWFYEKTGGPTVDGVIAMTPTVMQKLLEVTGPIEMPEYEVTIDANNFIEKIQYEVEVDYDKELNQPKKILGDLAPKVLDKIFNSGNFSDLSKTFKILIESLDEKQILIYSKNWEIEKVLSDNGWSGEILDTPKDYVSVINTNINGFKTDGVIEEKIFHKAEIQPDGSIIDTLTITRYHSGGDTAYEWWNKVNANYMRVYVPKGSQLLAAEGQTREFNTPPLDYNALGYRRDPQVQMEENAVRIDEETGTRVYEDANKTVFANWAYVSPKETVTLKYKYLLPFKIEMDANNPASTYSLLAQKQSGSIGSKFVSEIHYPDLYKVLWKYPERDASVTGELQEDMSGIRIENVLNLDRFIGVAFTK